MRHALPVLVIFALLSLPAGRASADPIDYVYLTTGQFGTMDLLTGTYTNIGSPNATYDDLTLLPGGPLYAADSLSRLLTVNTTTGNIASVVGSMGSNIEGIKFRGDGTLFGYNRSDLFLVSAADGAATRVGSFGISQGVNYSAAFLGGTMFLEENNNTDGTSNLYTVNTGTGAATLVGNTGVDLLAMSFDAGALYGFTTNGTIVTIDTTNARSTFVANQSMGVVLSAAPGAAVPEPGPLALAAVATAAVGAAARLRTRRHG